MGALSHKTHNDEKTFQNPEGFVMFQRKMFFLEIC